MHNSPPYADYLREPTWQIGLEACDKVVDGNFDDLNPQLLARYLRWLTGEARLLIADLKERGVEFAED
jgi:hypothetical protein